MEHFLVVNLKSFIFLFRYNKLSREVRTLCRKIRDLDPNDPFRVHCTNDLVEKLYNLGVIPTKENLELADKVNASSFCRRRLPVIMVKLRMAQSLKNATTFIEQGRILNKFVVDYIVLLQFFCLRIFCPGPFAMKIQAYFLRWVGSILCV